MQPWWSGPTTRRRALASRRHVPRPKVRDRRTAAALGDHRGVADLQRRVTLGMVGDGLSMGRDAGDVLESHTCRLGDRDGCGGKALAKVYIERSQLLERSLTGDPARSETVDALLKRRLEGGLLKSDQAKGARRRVVGPLHQGCIDTIRRGARHETDDQHDGQLSSAQET
jgi:hypothetical protein